jgi:hypothetical protein
MAVLSTHSALYARDTPRHDNMNGVKRTQSKAMETAATAFVAKIRESAFNILACLWTSSTYKSKDSVRVGNQFFTFVSRYNETCGLDHPSGRSLRPPRPLPNRPTEFRSGNFSACSRQHKLQRSRCQRFTIKAKANIKDPTRRV